MKAPAEMAIARGADIVANLTAFARLYGYVRYFHPSDETRLVDWERFAVYGAGEVQQAIGATALRDVLTRLFAPLAPSLAVYSEGERAPAAPAVVDGKRVVAWQHRGVGGSGLGWRIFDPYRSVRVRRARLLASDPIIDKPLARGVRVRLPLAPVSRSWLRRRSVTLGPLGDALAALDPKSFRATEARVRLAAIVIAWSTLQHFYPYFDVCAAGWNDALPIALHAALDDRDEEDLERTLRRMLVALEDGHATVNYRIAQGSRGAMPLKLGWIEERMVVVETGAAEVERGDVVIQVAGVPASEALREAESLVSGSPHWRRARGLDYVGVGPLGTSVELVLERDGMVRTVQLARGRSSQRTRRHTAAPAIRSLSGGVMYVDLSRATKAELKKRLPELSAAAGLIADMRGYPQAGNELLLAHLLREPCEHQMFQVPKIVQPDHEDIAGWDCSGWHLAPSRPRIAGGVAFLSGPGAISYAESILGFVEGHRLGEIVGGASAGANGNVNRTRLPAGFEIYWTGMRVVKHDGTCHHGIGVLPTIPVEPTLAGVREGRDEVLEAALQALTG